MWFQLFFSLNFWTTTVSVPSEFRHESTILFSSLIALCERNRSEKMILAVNATMIGRCVWKYVESIRQCGVKSAEYQRNSKCMRWHLVFVNWMHSIRWYFLYFQYFVFSTCEFQRCLKFFRLSAFGCKLRSSWSDSIAPSAILLTVQCFVNWFCRAVYGKM